MHQNIYQGTNVRECYSHTSQIQLNYIHIVSESTYITSHIQANNKHMIGVSTDITSNKPSSEA